MLIVALVLAVIGLAALVTAVVTSNELVAWVCIAASVVGVILLIVDAIRERSHRAEVTAAEPAAAGAVTVDDTYQNFDAEYPDETESVPTAAEDAPTEAEAPAEPATDAESVTETQPSAETEPTAESESSGEAETDTVTETDTAAESDTDGTSERH